MHAHTQQKSIKLMTFKTTHTAIAWKVIGSTKTNPAVIIEYIN